MIVTNKSSENDIKVLLVEDNPADADLTREALQDIKLLIDLQVVEDGEEALTFVRKEGTYKDAFTPDLIMLDLNLPKIDGREVLAELKQDPELCHIPIVILTTSADDEDILKSYKLHANCYITKPVGLNEFIKVIKSIEDFWLTVVKLPSKNN